METLDTAGFLTDEEFSRRLAELKGKSFPVLSKGSVTLVDVMGDDRRVVSAARTTSDIKGKTDKDDQNLIRFLRRHRHTTPFEFVEIDLKIVIPMDAWRQMIRHRTANVNEFSSRYSDVPDRNDVTLPGDWRIQSTSNRQGSGGALENEWPEGYAVLPIRRAGREVEDDVLLSYEANPDEYRNDHLAWGLFRLDDDHKPIEQLWEFVGVRYSEITPGAYLTARESGSHKDVRELYEERLKFKVAKEQARKDLQLSTYTEARWKCDLHNLLHYLGLRMDAHAQKEIRDYANIIGNEIIAKLFPVTWQAFLDYQLNAMTLTAIDISVISNITTYTGTLREEQMESAARAAGACDSPVGGRINVRAPLQIGWELFCSHCPPHWRDMKRSRERNECWAKLTKLGLVQGEIPEECKT